MSIADLAKYFSARVALSEKRERQRAIQRDNWQTRKAVNGKAIDTRVIPNLILDDTKSHVDFLSPSRGDWQQFQIKRQLTSLEYILGVIVRARYSMPATFYAGERRKVTFVVRLLLYFD